jgi:[ribosomal protein S5]-alanine N-acetyltransferase
MSITLVAIEPDGQVDTTSELSEHAAPVIAANVANYAVCGNYAPWLGYMTCAFRAPPAGDVVEIAYYTFPEHERKGYAQKAAKALIGIARDTKPDVVITAHTLQEEGPSCQVLRNSGFERTGAIDHPEDGPIWVWKFSG